MTIQNQIEIWNIILLKMKEKEYDEALIMIEDLVNSNIISSDILELRGRLSQLADKSGELFPDLTLESTRWSFEKSIELSLKPIRAHIELGYFKFVYHINLTDEALLHFEKAEENALYGLKDALIGKAKCLLEIGDKTSANIVLNKLKSLFPDDEDSKISWLELEEDF